MKFRRGKIVQKEFLPQQKFAQKELLSKVFSFIHIANPNAAQSAGAACRSEWGSESRQNAGRNAGRHAGRHAGRNVDNAG